MSVNRKSRRFEERTELNLDVEVDCQSSADCNWRELTQLKDVSRLGARFILAHQSESGQLLHLKLNLPRRFRMFDFLATNYRVWGVVRSVKIIEVADSENQLFETSVAFIGKSAPAAYLSDPTTRFDLKPAPVKNGLWSARPRPRKEFF